MTTSVATEERPDYELLEPIPAMYGYATILSSALLFQAINQILLRYGPSPVSAGDRWKWRNLLISWIHAVIVGTWDLTCFYWYPELMTDLIAFNNIYLYTMVAFSTGYFVHDFIDIVVSKNLRNTWEVVPHHFAVAGMFFYNVCVSRCIAYNVVALLAEVNTVFLHSRKLLQMASVPYSHWLYRVNTMVNLTTFLACRFTGLVAIVWGMFIWYDRVSPVYLAVLASSMFVMWVTNLMLFWRLLSSDVIRPYLRARKSGGALGEKSRGTKSVINGVNGNGIYRAPVLTGEAGDEFRSASLANGTDGIHRRLILTNGDLSRRQKINGSVAGDCGLVNGTVAMDNGYHNGHHK